LEENQLNSNQKLKNINIEKKIIVILPLIFLVALAIRFYHTPYGIPVILDGFLGYFLYALDISILGHLPNYTLSQSGWPEFLSLFFMSFYSDNLIDYQNLQRTISVILSAGTVIPIYFICKKFFNNYYSLIGATIFAFEPKIIINSTLGVSEPIYILGITLGILLFLNSNKKIIYSSFVFFACATIIRPEGQFVFIAFSIVYFLRFRKNRKDLALYLICLSIFLLVLSPIVMHRIECCENDGIIGRIIIELSNYNNKSIETNDQINTISYGPNYFNGIKLFGWSLIPIFVIFMPFGLIQIFKNLKFPNYLLIVIPSILSIPIIYSISIAPDTRYIYPIYPIFCIISLFGIRFIVNKFNNKKLIVSIIIISIILSSIVYLDFKKTDYSNDNEIHEIGKLLLNDVKGVNKSQEIGKFFKVIQIENRWPITESNGKLSSSLKINLLAPEDFTSLKEFIKFGERNGLSHLIIDNDKSTPDFFINVFNNEKKYDYLIKEFDSQEKGYDYHVKKFRINYEIFQNQKN
tara:strand:- start:82 stop:1644 length:1563 start_codon:yes stop_codon:yes gene_type:complete